MKPGWRSVALHCGLGALIGFLAAHQVAASFEYGSYFQYFATLAGGVFVYFSVDFRQTSAGITKAWNTAINWRPYLPYWKTAGVSWVATFMVLVTVIGWTAFLIWLFQTEDVSVKAKKESHPVLGSLILCIVVLLPFFYHLKKGGVGNRKYKESLKKSRTTAYQALIFLNPLTAPFSTLYILAPFVYLLGTELYSRAVRTGKAIGSFFYYVFVYIHSKRRTICFVDASLGGAIGLWYDQAIIAIVAGAILGVINYEIVSVRWLKLKPT